MAVPPALGKSWRTFSSVPTIGWDDPEPHERCIAAAISGLCKITDIGTTRTPVFVAVGMLSVLPASNRPVF